MSSSSCSDSESESVPVWEFTDSEPQIVGGVDQLSNIYISGFSSDPAMWTASTGCRPSAFRLRCTPNTLYNNNLSTMNLRFFRRWTQAHNKRFGSNSSNPPNSDGGTYNYC